MSERAIDALPMPAAYFRLILRRFGHTPALVAQILEGTGIDRETAESSGPGDVIRVEQQLQQVRNLSLAVGPAWALEAGQRFGTAAHGDQAAAIASAPDLGAALHLVERFAYLRAPYFQVVSNASPSAFDLYITPRMQIDPEVWAPLVEALMLSIQAVVESALGAPMETAKFQFDFDPPEYAARYRDAFHAAVEFGCAHVGVSVPTSWLPLPCPFADPKTHRRAIDRLELAKRRLQGPEFIVAQVEEILHDSEGAAPSVQSIAAQLHVSRRTLIRRLEQHGTSVRSLTERRQRRCSIDLLADTSLDVSEIADRLGYSEPSNFSRAFRRWFGKSPQEYRDAR
jgi:AraC-like DNA-binding protein